MKLFVLIVLVALAAFTTAATHVGRFKDAQPGSNIMIIPCSSIYYSKNVLTNLEGSIKR